MKRIFAKKQLPAAILAAAMTVSASAGLCGMLPTLSANAEDAPAVTTDGGGYTATRLGALDTIAVDGVMDEVYNDAAPIAINTVTWPNQQRHARHGDNVSDVE